MSKLDAYELIFRDVDGGTPRLTGTGNKVPAPNEEQQIVVEDVKDVSDSETTDTDEVTLEKLYMDYIAKGHGKMKAMEMAKSDLRELRKKAKENAKAEKKKAWEEERRRKQEEKTEKEEKKESELQAVRDSNLAALAGDVDDPDDGGDKSWIDHIKVDSHNAPLYLYKNTYALLHYHPKYAGKFEKNLFTYDYEYEKRVVDDEMMSHIRHFCHIKLSNVNTSWVSDAVTVEACKRTYHPVKDVIDTLVWDGTPRVETFFIDRLGAENTPLTRELTAKWMFAMLMRIYEPGCYFDHYLIVSDSKGGTGKTKTFQKLTECLHANVDFPLTPIITDITNDQNNVLMLQRTVLGLFDESEGMKYTNLERFKSFITTNKFTARLPYMRKPTVLDTHCVFAMNTNDTAFLTDNTTMYERRAWVLPCDGVRDAGEDYWEPRNNYNTLRQVWAELLHWYRNPESAPYDMTNNKFNFVSKGAEAALIEVQKTKKTSTLDVDLYNTVNSIFTNTYSKDRFFNERDFLTDFRHTKRGKDETDYDVELDVIPCDWVISVSQREVSGKRGTETVKNMVNKVLSDGSVGQWVLDGKFKYYPNKSIPCWVKVKPKGVDDRKEQGDKNDFFNVVNIPA